MLDGVKISESSAQKDELILQGNDINNVSQSGRFRGRLSRIRSVNISHLQPLPSRTAASSDTRTSGSSWTASTCRVSFITSIHEVLRLISFPGYPEKTVIEQLPEA